MFFLHFTAPFLTILGQLALFHSGPNFGVHYKRQLIEEQHKKISIERQCELIGLNRSSYYYQPKPSSKLTVKLLRVIDEEYTRHPFLGTRKMVAYLKDLGYWVNRKRIQTLYGMLGIEGIYPKPKLSRANKEHEVYPYLLREVAIERCNQVWSTDITFVRLARGFVYLVAIIDWFSRYVLTWSLSTLLTADFCVEALAGIISHKCCEIFNSDQGCQFTSLAFTDLLKAHAIQISMDGRGRALDNIFIERLWRSVKYECIYLNEFETVAQVKAALTEYFNYYNFQRPHQSLNYRTPAGIYLQDY